MNGITAIVKKEWRSFFFSPVAYMVIGVFVLILGLIFSFFVDFYNQNQAASMMGRAQEISVDRMVAQLFDNMAFILTFMSPMLTMRLFAEEKRQQTFELLFTAPIRGYELVLGKFLSAFGLLLVMLFISFFYIGFLLLWGNPELSVIMTTYLGLALSLGCYLALGGLISSFSGNQAIAAIINFVVLLFLYIVQALGQNIKAKWGPIDWGAVMVYLSPLGHFRPFTEGLIHVRDVTYFLTFMALMLVMTHKVIESQRWR